MKTRQDRAKSKANLILLVCSVLFSLLLSEFIVSPTLLGLMNDMPRSMALLGFVATPNSQVDDVSINSQGFTGKVLEEPVNSKAAVRILTLGGSALFNRRMTDRLIEAFSRASPVNLEITGGALRVHSTRSSLIKYEIFFHEYRFDYVLIYHGINDLWMNHVAPHDFRDDYSHSSPWYKRNSLLDLSLTARYVYNNLLWKEPAEVHNGTEFASYKTYEDNLRKLIKLVRRDNGLPVLMTFAWHIPEEYTKEKFDRGVLGYNNPANYDKCPVELWGSVDYVRVGLANQNDIIRKIAKEENVMLIDQADELGNSVHLFGDVCHLSEVGTDYFIDNVLDFFLSNNLLPLK